MHNHSNTQLPQDVALLLAQEACRYARMYIKKGHTQLETNDLSSEQFFAINLGIYGYLGANQEKGLIGTRDAVILLTDEDYLTENKFLAEYDSYVFISAKYSLGNCGELAILALDFLLNLNTYSIHAELCVIAGGDHAFLLINREPTSNSLKNAFICDPWANKIYPAEEYRDKLQNYVFDKTTSKNTVEPFNPDKHELRRENFLSTSYFKFLHRILIPRLQNVFHKKSEDLISVAVRFQDQLLSLQDQDIDNTIQATLLNKCVQIANIIEKTRNSVGQLLEDSRYDDYRSLKARLYLALKQIRTDIKRVLIFNAQEAKILAPLIEELKKLISNIKKLFASCPTYCFD